MARFRGSGGRPLLLKLGLVLSLHSMLPRFWSLNDFGDTGLTYREEAGSEASDELIASRTGKVTLYGIVRFNGRVGCRDVNHRTGNVAASEQGQEFLRTKMSACVIPSIIDTRTRLLFSGTDLALFCIPMLGWRNEE